MHVAIRSASASLLGAGDIRQQRLRTGKQHKSKYDELEQSLHRLHQLSTYATHVVRDLDHGIYLEFCSPQPECIGNHGYRAEAHGGSGNHRAQQQAEEWVQNSSRERDTKRVVDEGKE